MSVATSEMNVISKSTLRTGEPKSKARTLSNANGLFINSVNFSKGNPHIGKYFTIDGL